MNPLEALEELYAALQERFFGKYRGFVESNEDPKGRGRLQVRVPNVMKDQLIWATPCVPYAGQGVGLFALPPKDAGVWVEFEGGDTSHPIWVGCFWADNQVASDESKPGVKTLRTDGAALKFDDDNGVVTIETGDGTTLTIGGGEIKLEANDVSASANGGKLALSAGGLDVNNGAFSVS
ncbi:phage baseplate assembly protein V [Shimia sp. Alg240-R146]|uniref:phage baseplate assembly protein V n=1 Tax=Shimia sp. Alg240-R146 TaxID=2993449 RepID=UPI0022E0F0C5|nr:phage baseplate assembly protein V [Shimia sp. Alg240-R146]